MFPEYVCFVLSRPLLPSKMLFGVCVFSQPLPDDHCRAFYCCLDRLESHWLSIVIHANDDVLFSRLSFFWLFVVLYVVLINHFSFFLFPAATCFIDPSLLATTIIIPP